MTKMRYQIEVESSTPNSRKFEYVECYDTDSDTSIAYTFVDECGDLVASFPVKRVIGVKRMEWKDD